MNKRLKEIRMSSDSKSLKEFALRLGVSDSSISLLENGKRNITDQMVKSICREFNVSESWFRTGEGEMYEEVLPLDEKALLFSDILNQKEDPFYDLLYNIGLEYMNSDPEMRQAIRQFVTNLKARRNKKDAE